MLVVFPFALPAFAHVCIASEDGLGTGNRALDIFLQQSQLHEPSEDHDEEKCPIFRTQAHSLSKIWTRANALLERLIDYECCLTEMEQAADEETPLGGRS